MKLPPVAAKLLKSRAGAAGGGRLSKLPRSAWYALAAGLLALGLVSSLLDLAARADKERAYAEQEKQRLVFVGEQGEAGGTVTPKRETDGDFDVDMSPEERKLNASKKSAAPQDDVPEDEPSADAVTDDETRPNADAKDDVPKEVEKASQTSEAPATEDAPAEEPPAAEPVNDAPKPEAAKEEAAPETAAEPTVVDGLVALSDTPPPASPAIKPNDKSLVFAPAREVTKQTKAGALPVLGEKGARPFDVYLRPYRPEDDKAMLGIVITGMGFSTQSLNLALALPPEISLSFSPYGNEVAKAIDSVRNAGHEVWFDLPTQSVDYPTRDPGPLGIISTIPAKDREMRLRKAMIETRGAVGAVFPVDDALKNTATALQGTLKTLKDHGLEAFYSGHDAPKGLRHPNIVLLSSASPTKLASDLSALTKSLNDSAPVIVLAQGSPHVLQAISRWVSTDLKNAPVSLAPLSAFYLDYAAIAAEAEAAAENAGKEKKGGH